MNVLSRLNHANLVEICAVQLDSLYFVQEHSDLGTLHDYLRTKTNDFNYQKYWKRIRRCFFSLFIIFVDLSCRLNIYFSHQLANALEYLSNLNIIHGDIATRNCLFFSNLTIKLTDCAMALAQYEHEYWMCINGEKIPLRWLAPEVLTVRNIRSCFIDWERFLFRIIQQLNRIFIHLLWHCGNVGVDVHVYHMYH